MASSSAALYFLKQSLTEPWPRSFQGSAYLCLLSRWVTAIPHRLAFHMCARDLRLDRIASPCSAGSTPWLLGKCFVVVVVSRLCTPALSSAKCGTSI